VAYKLIEFLVYYKDIITTKVVNNSVLEHKSPILLVFFRFPSVFFKFYI